MSVCNHEGIILYCFKVKWLLAIELPLFSKIMQPKHHSKEFSERNLILARVVKRHTLKGNCYLSCKTSLVSFETAMPSD